MTKKKMREGLFVKILVKLQDSHKHFREFVLENQMMFNNNNQHRHYPSNLSTYQNNFSVQSHNQQSQPLYNNTDSLFNEFG